MEEDAILMEVTSLALVSMDSMEYFVNTVSFNFFFLSFSYFFLLLLNFFFKKKNITHVYQAHVKMEEDAMFQMVETHSLVHASMVSLVDFVKPVIF